ncbi:hypothetical protein ACFX15_008285 [Malus domestica]
MQRVSRPKRGINEWLHRLPLPLHKKLMPLLLSAGKIGLSSDIPEADAKDGPLLVVASSRDTIPVSSAIKQLAPENMFLVQIQHPRSHVDRFDLVIAPRHDYYPLTPHAQKQILDFFGGGSLHVNHRAKVLYYEFQLLTVGALHQADFAALMSAASVWHAELAPLPKPLLVNVLWSCGSVRISFSGRTTEQVSRVLRKEFSTNPKVYIWDGEGRNPHMGHLACADAFVITADSVSMLREACITDFQNSLQERGAVRPFTGKEDMSQRWRYTPLNDTADAARRVNKTLAERGWSIQLT